MADSVLVRLGKVYDKATRSRLSTIWIRVEDLGELLRRAGAESTRVSKVEPDRPGKE